MKGFSIKRLECTLLLTILLLFTYAGTVQIQQQALADTVLRLHVVANSDTEEDQRVKLCVRDAVLTYTKPLLAEAKNQAQVRSILHTELQTLANIAQTELQRQGSVDTVTVAMQEEYYPTREYTDFSLPAGRYTGIRIKIGAAQGHNWWCVIFPPLCQEAAIDTTEALQEKERAYIRQDGTEYVVRFKTAEWLGEMKEKLNTILE